MFRICLLLVGVFSVIVGAASPSLYQSLFAEDSASKSTTAIPASTQTKNPVPSRPVTPAPTQATHQIAAVSSPDSAAPADSVASSVTPADSVPAAASAPGPIFTDSAASSALQALKNQSTDFAAAPPIKNAPTSARTAILYLDGSLPSPWFYLGVLEALERYQIPVERIVASGVAAWVTALWNQGYTNAAIAQLLQESAYPVVQIPTNITTAPGLHPWSDLVAPDGFPGLRQQYALDFSDSATAKLQYLPNTPNIIDFSGMFKMQAPLLRTLHPPRVPWQILLCQASTGHLTFSPVQPDWQWISASIDTAGLTIGKQKYAPAALCNLQASSTLQSLADSAHFIIYATPWPTRKDDLPLSASQRFQLQHFSADIAQHQISVSPHWLKTDSLNHAEYWRQLALNGMRSQLGQFKKYQMQPQAWPDRTQNLSVSGFHIDAPALDEISAEYQQHLRTYWPQNTLPWLNNLAIFTQNLQQDQLYGALDLSLRQQSLSESGYGFSPDSNTMILNLQAAPRSILKVQVGGSGATYSGPVFRAQASLRTVSQFEYYGGIAAAVGTQWQSVEPFLSIDKINHYQLGFTVRLAWQNQDYTQLWPHLPFANAQSNLEDLSKLRSLERHSVWFQVHFNPQLHHYLQPYIYVSDDYFNSEQIQRLNRNTWSKDPVSHIEVTAINAGLTYVWGADTSADFFAEQARNLHLNLALKSEAPHLVGSKPTHLNYAGTALFKVAQPLTAHWHLGFQAAFGLQGRILEGLEWIYPDSVDVIPQKTTDPALSNYYRLAIPTTAVTSNMPLPQFRSHHYASATAHTAWLWGPVGLWLHGAYSYDFEGDDIYNELQAARVAVEGTLRYSWRSLDARLGAHLNANRDDFTTALQNSARWLWFAQVGLINF